MTRRGWPSQSLRYGRPIAPPSCSSAAPTSASRRCSTASPAPAAPSSRQSPAPRATCIAPDGRVARRRRSASSTPAACSAPARTRCTTLVIEHGQARHRCRPTCSSSSSTAARGCVLRRRGDCAPCCARRGKPVVLAVNKMDDQRAATARSSSTSSASSRSSRSRPSTGRASRDLLDEVVGAAARAAGKLGGTVAEDEPDEIARRHRRPAQRRQVVARQPPAARGARARRERHARAPRATRSTRCCAGTSARSASSTRPASGGPGRVASRGQVEAVSVLIARARDRARRRRRAGDRRRRGRRPIRTRPIAGEAERAGCGVIIAANKWDLMKGRGPDVRQGVRRGAAAAAEVPRLRAARCTSRR